MTKHLLLTGATGLLGQYLLRDLLLAGVPVAAVVRSRREESAEKRLERVVAHWEAELRCSLPPPVCLEGDISLPALGLSAADRRWTAQNVGAVLHNAASLQFDGKDRTAEPWASNLTGTAHVLELCREARLRELHHVSTAYVCGRRTGRVFESELECGQEFTNDYEQCKYEAEQLVRSADHLDSLTVYRPAVIVGDSHTGYTTTYHGLYPYVQFVWLVSQMLPPDKDGRIPADVRLNLTGEEARNLIPVEWVSAVTVHIFRHRALHGRTYHLTPVQAVLARELEEAMCSRFNLYGPRFVGRDVLAPAGLNDLEKMFYEFVGRYQPYWESEPQFDCGNTLAAAPHLPCPQLDRATLHRLFDFAVANRWGKGREKRRREPAAVSLS